jgi:acyl carrier protein
MGSFLITDSRWVFRADPKLGAAAAVSGTMAYATAWLALHTQARVRAGDDVLVHSAAGGVGLAAVALCVAAGCRIFATASTDEKRRMLLTRGVTAVFNSRSHSEFSAGVLEATGGLGVDVVLNSLAGEALVASIELLKPFGRLVELGKRDAYEGREISLAPFLKGITISAAHIDVLMLERPDTARLLFDEVRAKMPTLPVLPCVTYPMDAVDDALQFMSGGTHIGKILIAASAVPAAPLLPFADHLLAPDDALARSVASALGTRPAVGASRHGRCVVLAEPPNCTDGDVALDDALCGAEVVITRSQLVAWYATRRAGVPLAIEMRAPWAALAPSLVRQLMALRGRGHVVARAASAEANDTDAEWVPLLVSELVTSEVDPDAPLESYGLDSLMLITLASRLTARLGRRVTAEELEKLGTMRALQDAVRAGDKPTSSTAAATVEVRTPHGATGASAGSRRQRILCIHGYRSSAEVMELQMRQYASALGDSAEFVFVEAPTRSTGPQDPTIPDEVPTFEWYGVVGGSYEKGWLHEPQPEVLDEGLRAINAQGPYDGAIGFSQGGAIASMIDARWAVLFSTITPPPGRTRKWGRPTLHVFDQAEEYVLLCDEMAAQARETAPDATEVANHKAGHNVPQDTASVEAVVRFCRAQLEAKEKAEESGSGWIVV